MKSIQKRFLLFLLGCIPTRILLTYLAKTIPVAYLPYMGGIMLFPAIGFIYIYATGSRKTGAEVFGEKIWWNNLRPVHGALLLLFSYMAITGNRHAWKALAVDTFIGFISFLVFHLYIAAA